MEKTSVNERIAILEAQFDFISKILDSIQNNDLKHLRIMLENIGKKIPVLTNDVRLIKQIVYGTVSIILLAFLGAMIALVIRK